MLPRSSNRGGFHKGASRGARGAGGPGGSGARFARFPGFLAVLGPVRHARGIGASVATSQLNMSPWRPFPGLFVAETVDLGRFWAPLLEMQRPQCCCCTHQQALLCCCTTATALVWLPHTPCVVSTQRQVCGSGCGCGSGSGCGRHAAKSGAAGLHTRTQDRFPALRGDKRKLHRRCTPQCTSTKAAIGN